MITTEDIDKALLEYDAAYDKVEELGRKKTEAQKDMETKRRIALDLLERVDKKSYHVGRRQFIVGETVYAKVTDEPAFMEWAKTQGEDLFQMKPHKKLLNGLARTSLDDQTPMPPGLEARVQEKITRR